MENIIEEKELKKIKEEADNPTKGVLESVMPHVCGLLIFTVCFGLILRFAEYYLGIYIK